MLFVYIIEILIKIILIIVPLLLSVAYFTLAERKILGAVQRRRGPNVVGAYGLLQPLSDGFKLFVKEGVMPSNADLGLFIISPIIFFVVSLIGWSVIPYDNNAVLSENSLGMFFLLALSSLSVYGVIFSGWSSNSKYAFLGALRSSAQMISYEVSIGFIIITVLIPSSSFNLQEIIYHQETLWNIIPFFPLFLMFFTSALAETNRHPFDLPEAEAELVSGYNVEYSGMSFALFSLGEYSNMLLMSALSSILFLGGWLSPFPFLALPGSFWLGLKISFFVILFVAMRAALPRYRYDQLMSLGWRVFLPLSILYLMLTFILFYSFSYGCS